MYRFDTDYIYGKSILYKDDEKVEEIKKINKSLTILHFLEEQNENHPIEKMTNILTKVSERKNSQSPTHPPPTESSLPS